MPIPNNTTGQAQKTIEEIVHKILDEKKSNPENNTDHYESNIDQIVYKLYGLTDEEIAVVEGAFTK